MALTAQQESMTTGVRGAGTPAAPDYPRWARRRVMLAVGAGLWATLVGVCSVCGPSPLLWGLIGAIWAALALVCIRIQVYRGQVQRGRSASAAQTPASGATAAGE